MNKIAVLFGGCVALASIAAASPAQAGWTGYVSEEDAPAYCPGPEAATGFACWGDYCDEVALHCNGLPSWSSLDISTRYWTSYFSEEGDSDLGEVVCSDGPSGGSCEAFELGDNVRYCFGGRGSKGIVTGIDCADSYCDEISLECTKPAAGRLTGCSWSGWLSEEEWYVHFGTNRFITAVECSGDYCDNKRFYVCSLVQ
ncbi:hypothetical protein ACSRUE_15510 [Sorangium sp. KYC3313]|uniref:Secreted protein n=1 Tax=Sorangium cellulosum (strain So ce56) TaxID=448385 RepID=A9GPL2_SORC5|nr:hypothetical protein [Sorangium cellulosum]CAN96774.1 hypothetical protein predicted by Glimmer/Critica [Sorangium cellulosum So ce56]